MTRLAAGMDTSVAVDAANGDLTFGACRLSLRSALADLPAAFRTREQTTLVEGREVPCVFASATLQARETRFELGLRYEQGRLVSAALAIEPKHFRDLRGDAFYESSDARHAYHERWLRQFGLSSCGLAERPWGSVGVVRDKSENVFVLLQAGRAR